MNKTLLLMLAGLAGASEALAQRYEWVRTADAAVTIDSRMAVTVDDAGNSYHACSYVPPLSVGGQALTTWPGMGGYDIAVCKFDPEGTLAWSTVLGSGASDDVHDIAVDASGAVYVGVGNIGASIITEDSVFANPTGNCIIKLDPSGHCRLAASFTGNVRLDAIRTEVYVSAYQTIYRLDTALAIEWSHTAQTGTPFFDGGSNGRGRVAVRGDKVAFSGFDLSGDLSIAGLSQAGNGIGYDQSVVFVVDTAGTGLWSYMTDGANAGLERVNDLAIDAAGNVFLGVKAEQGAFQFAGSTVENSNSSVHICALLKLDTSGQEEWAVQFQPNFGGEVYAVAVSDAGEAALTGSMGDGGAFGPFSTGAFGGLYLAKAAADGTPVWLKDDQGGAQNGEGVQSWMDDGPGGELWLGFRTFATITMDCATITSAPNFMLCRISDTSQTTPFASFTFTDDNLTVLFTNASNDADAYSWDFGDGNSSSESDPGHTYSAQGTYTVILTAISGTCTDTYTAEVTVISTDSDEIEGSAFTLHPNPADDQLTVASPRATSALRILDASGRVVLEDAGTGHPCTRTMDISALEAGTYVVQMLVGDGWWGQALLVR